MKHNSKQLHITSLKYHGVELNLQGAGTIAVFRCAGGIIHHRLTDSEYVTYRHMVYHNRRSAMDFLLGVVLNGSRFNRADFGIEGSSTHCAELEEFGKETEAMIKEKGGI